MGARAATVRLRLSATSGCRWRCAGTTAGGRPPTRAPDGTDYGYLLDDDPTRPCPTRGRGASRTACTALATFDPGAIAWTDGAWTGRQLAGSVIYELHVGTFTPEGTFDAAIGRLDHLRSIGVDLVELMPVNAFNGTHNWGYDGVLWSPSTRRTAARGAYQRFVDACHAAGLGVIQDVVYNHLGPSGNYLPVFGPYLKDGRNTWGDLVNLDGEGPRRGPPLHPRQRADVAARTSTSTGCGSTPCTRWSTTRATHLLEEMADEVAALSAHQRRPLTLIAESDLNDPRWSRRARPAATASTPSGATTSTTPCTWR